MTSTFDKLFIPIFFTAILIIGGVWSFKTIYEMKNPELNKKEVTFNVVGVVNATNSSVIALHLECIKYCVDELKDIGQNAMTNCFNQCKELGCGGE